MHSSSYRSVRRCLSWCVSLGCLVDWVENDLYGWLIFSQVLVGFLWFPRLSVCLCGFRFGLFASKCGFYVYEPVCVLGGILVVEAGSCLQSGSQQSPHL